MDRLQIRSLEDSIIRVSEAASKKDRELQAQITGLQQQVAALTEAFVIHRHQIHGENSMTGRPVPNGPVEELPAPDQPAEVNGWYDEPGGTEQAVTLGQPVDDADKWYGVRRASAISLKEVVAEAVRQGLVPRVDPTDPEQIRVVGDIVAGWWPKRERDEVSQEVLTALRELLEADHA